MHQMGLAQADPTIEKQRVERDRAALGDPARGGMGQFIRLAHHKTVKGNRASIGAPSPAVPACVGLAST